MKIVSNGEVRAFEERAIASGIPADVLMERAAAGIASVLLREFPRPRPALVLAGKGNNGGDGLAVARRLAEAGWSVSVGLAFDPAQTEASPLCAAKLASFRAAAPTAPVLSLAGEGAEIPWPDSSGVVIDALLGIGARGALNPVLRRIVERANAERNRRFFRVAAVDGPTGAHRLAEGEPALVADLTLTLGFGKEPLFCEAAADSVGRLFAIPIFEGAD
ncbi:MAG TPA: NAD(P)H-hydrate epimerase, partial [Candidatus Methylacidiphilales bacterium]